MTTQHPGELALYAYLRDPEQSPDAAHISDCSRCLERVEELQAAGAEFQAQVFPRTVEAVTRRAGASRSRWWLWLMPLPVLAMAGLLLARRPAEDYVGTRGAVLSFTVLAADKGDWKPVAEGEQLPANAELRFQVRSERPCSLSIASVDAKGEVSRIVLPGAAQQQSGMLAAGAVLDGEPGPERFFAFCATGAHPADPENLLRSVGMNASTVRQMTNLIGLSADTVTATLLIEKTRPD